MRIALLSFVFASLAACSSSAGGVSQSVDPVRTAPAEATPASCDALQDRTTDVCLPDDDAPVAWDACLSSLDGKDTKTLASACCDSVSNDWLWCPKPTKTACEALSDWSMDHCVPDDDAAVDWKSCFAIATVGAATLAQQCCADGASFLWCAR